jgi:hypothetical protein
MLIRIENITMYASVIIFLYRIDTLTHLLVINSVTVIDSHRLSFISQLGVHQLRLISSAELNERAIRMFF